MSTCVVVIVVCVMGCFVSIAFLLKDLCTHAADGKRKDMTADMTGCAAKSVASNNPARRHSGPLFLVGSIGVVVICGAIPVFMGGRASPNPLQSMGNAALQADANNVIEFDPRSDGIVVSTYYRSVMDKSIVVFDLKSLSGGHSPADVFRVFLDFAERRQDTQCEKVELAYDSRVKFCIEGSYFSRLGQERGYQNPIYTMRTFCENLYTPTGASAYPTWTGGMLGVVKQQMEDFNDFNDKWYLDDILSSSSSVRY